MAWYINAFGVYQDYYVRVYLTGYSPDTIGWIGGMQIFLNFIVGVISGRLFDKGYFRSLFVASVLLHAVALFTLSLTQAGKYYQVFLANGVAFGAASGLLYVPSLSIVTHYFKTRRPIVLGLVSSGSALGAVLHPIMLNKLFNGPIGFHNGIRVSAGLNLFLLLAAFAMMRTRLPPKTFQRFPVKDWILKEPEYALALAVCVFSFFALFFPIFYIQYYALTHGVQRSVAFYILSILNASSFFGRLVPNALAPKLGLTNLIVFFTFSAGVITLTFPAVKDLVGIVLFAVFWGFCSGAVVSLGPAYVGVMAKDLNETGTRLGIFFSVASVVALFASPICGALLTEKYLWLNASLFSGISFIIAAALALLSRNILAKKRGTQII
ncbi:hypothetical protein MD484_g2277, partial [Candolleomyces efflorescens]